MSSSVQISEAQLAANRANAQLSCGPRSAEGKAKVSMNAVKTGLTGRTVLLPTEDAAKYQALLDDYFAEFQPVGIVEKTLTQSLVDARWRIDRAAKPMSQACPCFRTAHFTSVFRELRAKIGDAPGFCSRCRLIPQPQACPLDFRTADPVFRLRSSCFVSPRRRAITSCFLLSSQAYNPRRRMASATRSSASI